MSGEGFSQDPWPREKQERVWTPDGYYDEDGYWVDCPQPPPITRSERVVYKRPAD